MAERCVITIVLTDDGKVNVTGPVHDKILTLGLIEIAKQAVLSPEPSSITEKANDGIRNTPSANENC